MYGTTAPFSLAIANRAPAWIAHAAITRAVTRPRRPKTTAIIPSADAARNPHVKSLHAGSGESVPVLTIFTQPSAPAAWTAATIAIGSPPIARAFRLPAIDTSARVTTRIANATSGGPIQ